MNFADIIRNNKCFNLFFALVPTCLIIGFFLLGFLKKKPNLRKVLRSCVLSLLLLPIILLDFILLLNEKILETLILTAPLLIIGILVYIFRKKKRIKAVLVIFCALIVFLFSWSVVSYVLQASSNEGDAPGCLDVVLYLKDYQIKQRLDLLLMWKENYCDKKQEEVLKELEEFKNGFCKAHFDDLRSRDCEFYSDDCYRFDDRSETIVSEARRFCPHISWRFGPNFMKPGFYCRCIDNKCISIVNK